MNATVMTTGPGVIIATATASRNWRSVSHRSSFTTAPCRKGTMASPLPKMNAPASANSHAMRPRLPSGAGPCSPVTSQGHGATTSVAPARRGLLATSATTPQRTKSQTSSDSVHAVTRALARKSTHRSQSLPSVLFVSFHALRAMIAMTAAPMP
jgi:hypothetical protein